MASNVLKYFAPPNLHAISSNVSIEQCSLLIAAFKNLGSMRIRILPFGLRTKTKAFTHSDGPSTFVIMLFSYGLSNVSFKLSSSGIGTFRIGLITGCAFSLTIM